MRDEPRNESGISLRTLLIAAASSATAAFLVPMLWEPGTVFAAAMTPIVVTLVSEALKKPATTVSAVTTRRAPRRRRDERAGGFDPLAPAPREELEALPSTSSSRTVRTRRGPTRRHWAIAFATGVLAFGLAVAAVTTTELLAGERPGDKDNPTTFFGRDRAGGTAGDDDEREEPEATREPEATPTPTPGSAPAATPTPTPATTAAPTATPTPTAVPGPAAAPPAASPTPAP